MGLRSRYELHEKNGFLEGIFDNATEGIFVLNDEGKYIKMNPALNKIVGRTIDESDDTFFGSSGLTDSLAILCF